MAPRPSTFEFARVNVLSHDVDKETLLMQALVSPCAVTKGSFRYRFVNVEQVASTDGIFAIGELAKYRPDGTAEVLDEETSEIVDEETENSVYARPPFVLHLDTHVLAYQPVGSRLGPKQYRSVFSEIAEAVHHQFFIQVIVESISEHIGIGEALDRLDVIEEISVNLVRANPHFGRTYEHVDRRLERVNVARFHAKYTAATGGFDKDTLADDDIAAEVAMASDGYGRARIRGLRNGDRIVIGNASEPVTAQVYIIERGAGVVDQLLNTFRRVWRRQDGDG